MAHKDQPEEAPISRPTGVPPIPKALPTSDAKRPHTSPMRNGEEEPVDPELPPSPSNDPNP